MSDKGVAKGRGKEDGATPVQEIREGEPEPWPVCATGPALAQPCFFLEPVLR